ncbi:MAG: hypothetical protein ACP5Q4_09120 [Candidatus Caldatribacteriaceae bacterium]
MDIFIKDVAPCGRSRKLVVEVKRHRAQEKDVHQLHNYLQELGEEALKGILIARDVPQRTVAKSQGPRFSFFRYAFEDLDPHRAYPLEELRLRLRLEPLRCC